MNITTRGYPRTLHDAFPDDRAEWAQPMEDAAGNFVPLPKLRMYDYESAGHRLVFILSIVGIVGFLVWTVCEVMK
jgi:hypothetical protein